MRSRGRTSFAQQPGDLLYKTSSSNSGKLEHTITKYKHWNTIGSVVELALLLTIMWGLHKGLVSPEERYKVTTCPACMPFMSMSFRNYVLWYGIGLTISHIVELTIVLPKLHCVMRDCDKMEFKTLGTVALYNLLSIYQVPVTANYIPAVIVKMGVPIWMHVPVCVLIFGRCAFLVYMMMYFFALKKERKTLVLIT